MRCPLPAGVTVTQTSALKLMKVWRRRHSLPPWERVAAPPRGGIDSEEEERILSRVVGNGNREVEGWWTGGHRGQAVLCAETPMGRAAGRDAAPPHVSRRLCETTDHSSPAPTV